MQKNGMTDKSLPSHESTLSGKRAIVSTNSNVLRHSAALLVSGAVFSFALPAAAQSCLDGIVQQGTVTSPIAGSFQYVGNTVALTDNASSTALHQEWKLTGPAGATTLTSASGPINWTPSVAGNYSATILVFSPGPGSQVSHCATSAPFSFIVTAPPVYVKPKYQVVGVYYAPPGAKSTTTYSAGFTAGTSTSVASSFNVSTQVALTGTYAISATSVGFSGSGTVSAGWTQEKDNSSQITVSTQESSGTVVPGPTSSAVGVDHDYDIIWVWLNPELSLSALSTQVQVNGYAYDPNDPVAGADVVPVYVGELKGTLPIPADLQYRLQRPWDSATGALTAADYTNILAADPLAVNPSFDPNLDTSGRYERPRSAAFPNGDTTPVNYIPAPPGAAALCFPYSFATTNTSAIGQGAKDSHSVGFSVDAKYSLGSSVGLSSDLKVSTTLTTTNSWSQTVTNGTSQSAAFQICGPLATDNYTGYTAMQVWKDNVYGTFMFFPEP